MSALQSSTVYALCSLSQIFRTIKNSKQLKKWKNSCHICHLRWPLKTFRKSICSNGAKFCWSACTGLKRDFFKMRRKSERGATSGGQAAGFAVSSLGSFDLGMRWLMAGGPIACGTDRREGMRGMLAGWLLLLLSSGDTFLLLGIMFRGGCCTFLLSCDWTAQIDPRVGWFSLPLLPNELVSEFIPQAVPPFSKTAITSRTRDLKTS